MGLKDIINKMHQILERLDYDLKKSERGNKAAAQRVRVGSIKFSKLSKEYRKLSIDEEKKSTKAVKKNKSSKRK